MSPKESIAIFGYSNGRVGPGGPGHHGSGTGSKDSVAQVPVRERVGLKILDSAARAAVEHPKNTTIIKAVEHVAPSTVDRCKLIATPFSSFPHRSD
jgi:hypothetical protein